jgi:nucleoside-diphosphate-sugar epimerase
MRAALIGYTGFVGNNLKQQHNFTDFYNSKNFNEMRGQEYDLVVCAGVSAVKWQANKEPVKDLEAIKALQDVLSTIGSKKFILISTIDVYPVTHDKDETFDCGSIENHAYGKHRLAFEKFCESNFEDNIIIRLPGLFGDGLKKNVIYDFLNDNCLEMINENSSFQYYYLKNLWADIQVAVENNIRLLNLFTEPLKTQEIYKLFFPLKKIGHEQVPEAHYDLHTKYAGYWNNKGNYIYTKEQVMSQLKEFIESYQKQQGD